MPQLQVLPDSFSFNTAISACEKVGEVFRARRLLAEMQNHACQKEAMTCNSIISAAQKGRHWELALEALQDMYSSLLMADEISYSAAIGALQHCARWEHALDLFRASKLVGLAQGPAACNGTVIACMTSSRWQAAIQCVTDAPVADLTISRPMLDASARSGLADILLLGVEQLTKQLAYELNVRSVGLQKGVLRPPLLQQGRSHCGLPAGADIFVGGASLELAAAATEALESHAFIGEGLGRAFWRGVVAEVAPVCRGLAGTLPTNFNEIAGAPVEGKQLRIEVLRKRASLGASCLKVLTSAVLQSPPNMCEPQLRAHLLAHLSLQQQWTNHCTDPPCRPRSASALPTDQERFAVLKAVPAAAHLVTTAQVDLQLAQSSHAICDLIICSGVSRRAAPRAGKSNPASATACLNRPGECPVIANRTNPRIGACTCSWAQSIFCQS